jgi:tripartite ATP-independent transporter DctM subunit
MLTAIVFFTLLLLGFPIALTLIAGTIAFIALNDLGTLFGTLPVYFYESLAKNGLLAIPLFMLVGEIMNRGGLTQRLMSAAEALVGGFRGGLAYVNLLTNAMAAAILGSATAQIAVMSKIMIPEMLARGYSKGFSTALTTAGGLLGPIIPPSMLMIIYGVIAYQPIATLFIAGVIPGLVMASTFAVIIFVAGLFSDLPKAERGTWRQSGKKLLTGLVPGIIPAVIISGIISGAMSPTESGAVASLLALVLGMFVYKKIKWSDIPKMLESVALTTSVITGLIAAASIFGWALSFEGVPDRMVAAISDLSNSPLIFLFLVNVALFILGMFLETISVMIIIVPILLPTAQSLGVHPIHFGVVICIGTVVGLLTPPVGPGLYIAIVEAKIKIQEVIGWVLFFIAATIVTMALVAIFPALSTWLPSFFGMK